MCSVIKEEGGASLCQESLESRRGVTVDHFKRLSQVLALSHW